LVSVMSRGWLESALISVFIVALMRNADFINLVTHMLGSSQFVARQRLVSLVQEIVKVTGEG
jgi:fatty-acid desaturase